MIHRLPKKPKDAGLAQINRQLAQSETIMRQMCENVQKAESARAIEQIQHAPVSNPTRPAAN